MALGIQVQRRTWGKAYHECEFLISDHTVRFLEPATQSDPNCSSPEAKIAQLHHITYCSQLKRVMIPSSSTLDHLSVPAWVHRWGGKSTNVTNHASAPIINFPHPVLPFRTIGRSTCQHSRCLPKTGGARSIVVAKYPPHRCGRRRHRATETLSCF